MTQPAHRVVQISVIDWANSLNGKPPIGADLARLIATLAAAVEADRASTHARSSERIYEASAAYDGLMRAKEAFRAEAHRNGQRANEASFRETLRIERDCRLNEVRLKDEFRSRALAAEARLAKATWQPIGTATKDGSRTLIAWLTIKNEWRFSFAKWDPSIEHYCLEDRDAMVGARYWMPLPAPDAVSSPVTEKTDG